jgi:thymidylate synthase
MNQDPRREDLMVKDVFLKILREGCMDENPRPHYADGTPAHTLSVNHVMQQYDLSKGEFPITTLRPIAVKTSIAELLWIYQKQSNDLVVFDDLIGKPSTRNEDGTWHINNWWDDWALRDENGNYILNEEGHPTIGQCYGATVRRHDLINKLIRDIKNDPDGRRHIISMWQEDDFKEPHGLKPCAFQTIWNVRHGKDGIDYLDMCLIQRSSDYATAGSINQVQYSVLLLLIARCLGYTAGQFTWFVDNIQIYDRHIDQVKEMLARPSIPCTPHIELNPKKDNFYDFTVDDIKLVGYPRDIIKEKNPQLKFELGI